MSLALLGLPLAVLSVWGRLSGVAWTPDMAVVMAILSIRFDRDARFVRVTLLTAAVEGLVIGRTWAVWPLAALAAGVFAYGAARVVAHRTWIGCGIMAFLATWVAGGVVRLLEGGTTTTWVQASATAAVCALFAVVAGRRRGANLPGV
ncbi:MAG: hypothetical protein RIS21_864 [Planctomycetota bacterium]